MSYLENLFKYSLVNEVFSGDNIDIFCELPLNKKRIWIDFIKIPNSLYTEKIKKIKQLEYEVLNDIEEQYDT